MFNFDWTDSLCCSLMASATSNLDSNILLTSAEFSSVCKLSSSTAFLMSLSRLVNVLLIDNFLDASFDLVLCRSEHGTGAAIEALENDTGCEEFIEETSDDVSETIPEEAEK
uniref:N1883 protein n=1 Tax=Saccharomyces cerevisiae TaxID=4932 RepID=E9PAF6_YEASX|nr:N1883 [Saccharomyces cerevisiae]